MMSESEWNEQHKGSQKTTNKMGFKIIKKWKYLNFTVFYCFTCTGYTALMMNIVNMSGHGKRKINSPYSYWEIQENLGNSLYWLWILWAALQLSSWSQSAQYHCIHLPLALLCLVLEALLQQVLVLLVQLVEELEERQITKILHLYVKHWRFIVTQIWEVSFFYYSF